jgi:hypothetical protein
MIITLFNKDKSEYVQVAIVNTVVPVADILGPTLAGFIADRIGNFK